jgi:hypothetical protein
MSQHSMCVHQVSRKTNIFGAYVKIYLKNVLFKAIFNTKFFFFTHDTKNVVFSWNDFVSI